jgi:hypothetical protein
MVILNHAVATSRGICLACKHAEGCIYPRNQGQIVLNCEQFEPCAPMASPSPSKAQIDLEELWKKPSGNRPGTEFKGLCSNCEERYSCIYPKPPEGVWHCEEYR